MANEVMQSLFGLNSQDAALALRKQQAAEDLSYARLDPRQQIMFNAQQAGRNIGGGINQLFGLVPEPLQRVRNIEGALQEAHASGVGFDDPKFYSLLAEQLARRGLQQDALTVSAYGRKSALDTLKTQSEIDKNKAFLTGKLPATVQEYQFAVENGYQGTFEEWQASKKTASKASASIQEYEAAQTSGFTGTFMEFLTQKNARDPSSVKEYEYAQSQGYKGSFEQFIKEKAKAGATNVTVGDKPGDVGGMSSDIRQTLKPLKEKIDTINNAQALLDQARKGNASASVQLARSLATLSGDTQLSMAEVQSISNAGSLDKRIANTVVGYLSGNKIEPTYDEWQAVLDALGAAHGNAFNTARQSSLDVWTGVPGISPERVAAAAGAAWKPRAETIPAAQPAAPKNGVNKGDVKVHADANFTYFKTPQGTYYKIDNKTGTQIKLRSKGKK